MRRINAKDMRSLVSFLGLALLLVCSFGCGGPSSSEGSGGESSSAASSGDVPELTDELIRERINYAFVRNIPEETGNGEAMNWTFIEREPKEISIVDKKIQGDRATVVLDIKTRSSPRARGPRALSGQIRTEWMLRSGWVLRQWEIVNTENISMKYKKLPDVPPDNANANLPHPGSNSDLPKLAVPDSDD